MARGFARELLMAVGVARLTLSFLLRQPAWLAQSLFFAASLFILLWAWGGERGVGYMISGYVAISVFGAGVNMVGQTVGWYRVMGVLSLFIASPITPRAYMAGAILASTAFILAGIPPLLIAGAAFNQTKVVAASLATAPLLLPASVLLGLTIAFYVKKPTNISAITNPITLTLSMLPPVFYPASALPDPLKHIALLAPTAAAATLARTLSGLEQDPNPIIPTTTLLAWTIASAILANKIVKWTQE
ncbi:MAG: ABC transporter permease [Acidilobaceae archaeon]